MCLGLPVSLRSFAVVMAIALASGARAAAPSPVPKAPPAPREEDPCLLEAPHCDYASGEGCPAVPPEAPAFGPEAARVAALEPLAQRCDLGWGGPKGCYETGVRKEVDALVATSAEVAAARARAQRLPEGARRWCSEPVRAQEAIDEAPAWCALGRAECIDALRAARRVLEALSPWEACVARMEAWVAENARLDSTRAGCESEWPEVELPPLPSPEETPAPAPRPAARPLKVVELTHGKVIEPGPVEPAAPAERVARAPEAPASSVVVTQGRPRRDDDRREGQVELAVTPFSGVLTIRDPATRAEHRPMMASVRVGLAGVVRLTRDIALELGIAGRGSFASTALGQAAATSLAELDTETGTAFVVELEPSAIVLSQNVGLGIVTDLRWDTISVTSAANGLVSTKVSGAAAGARMILGLGMLERDLRLALALDWMFITPQDSALRVSLQADLGPMMLVGSYRQHFRLGGEAEAYLVDDLQLALGYRMVF